MPAVRMSVVVWRFVCISCRPSLAYYGVNHFLASYSLKPTPFRVGLLLGCGLFLLQSTPLLFSAVFACPAILLCYSCCSVYLTQAYWASLGLLLTLPSMTQYSHLSFLVTLLAGSCVPFSFWASLAHLLSLGPFGPFS